MTLRSNEFTMSGRSVWANWRDRRVQPERERAEIISEYGRHAALHVLR